MILPIELLGASLFSHSFLVVWTVTMGPHLASESVFSVINLGSENNFILPDFSLKLKAYMNLKGTIRSLFTSFPCFVIYYVQFDVFLFLFTRFMWLFFLFFYINFSLKTLICQMCALGGGWGGGGGNTSIAIF